MPIFFDQDNAEANKYENLEIAVGLSTILDILIKLNFVCIHINTDTIQTKVLPNATLLVAGYQQ